MPLTDSAIRNAKPAARPYKLPKEQGLVLTANGGDGNLVETTPQGKQVAVSAVETATGAGSLFGLAIAPDEDGVYFVDDGDNTLRIFTER